MRELASERDWIIVSADLRIFRNPGQKAIWVTTRLTTFFLQPGWVDVSLPEQAWRLMRWLPRFIHAARKHDGGTGLSIPLRYHQGSLTQLYRPR